MNNNLNIAASELKEAVRWRDLAKSKASARFVRGARILMREHALRSRRALAGNILYATSL
jgi:hypothetical protein